MDWSLDSHWTEQAEKLKVCFNAFIIRDLRYLFVCRLLHTTPDNTLQPHHASTLIPKDQALDALGGTAAPDFVESIGSKAALVERVAARLAEAGVDSASEVAGDVAENLSRAGAYSILRISAHI